MFFISIGLRVTTWQDSFHTHTRKKNYLWKNCTWKSQLVTFCKKLNCVDGTSRHRSKKCIQTRWLVDAKLKEEGRESLVHEARMLFSLSLFCWAPSNVYCGSMSLHVQSSWFNLVKFVDSKVVINCLVLIMTTPDIKRHLVKYLSLEYISSIQRCSRCFIKLSTWTFSWRSIHLFEVNIMVKLHSSEGLFQGSMVSWSLNSLMMVNQVVYIWIPIKLEDSKFFCDAKVKDNNFKTWSFSVMKERKCESLSSHVNLSDQCLVKVQCYFGNIKEKSHTQKKNFEKSILFF